jgi:hypothetical protein
MNTTNGKTRNRLITCPHKKHILMRQDTVIRFPVKKYKKRLNDQGKKLTKEMFYRLVEFFNVYQQLPLSPRRNGLPVKLIDWARLMIRAYATRALIELRQIGQTPPSTDPVLQHAPEAFNRIEVVSAMRRQEIQPKRLVPVCQRRRELMRPMEATAVSHQDHLFAGVATEGHHLMDVWAQPLRSTMGDHLIEDF